MDLTQLIGYGLIRTIQARSNHQLIYSNQEIALENRINQLQIALLQIDNLQKIEESRSKTAWGIEETRLVFQEKMALLGFQRQMSIEELKFELNKELRKVDHNHQWQIEGFKKEMQLYLNQDNQKFQKWRLQKEHEYRMQREVFYTSFQKEIAEKNRVNAQELIQEKKFFDESWPLKNTPLVYTNIENPKINIFISPPTISEEDVKIFNFPIIEEMITQDLELYILPFYKNLISINDGGWLNKKYKGSSALKPLANRLKFQSFMVIESIITKLEKESLLSLRVAHKQEDEEDTNYQTIVHDFSYKNVLIISAINRAETWQNDVKPEHFISSDSEVKAELNSYQKNLITWNQQQINHSEDYYDNYIFDSKDWKILIKFWSFLHSMVICCKMDIHFFIVSNRVPSFPRVFKLLLENFPNFLIEHKVLSVDSLFNNVIEAYKSVFRNLLLDKADILPEILLTMSKDVLELPNKYNTIANSLLKYSLDIWCDNKNLSISSLIPYTYYLSIEDKEYLISLLNTLKSRYPDDKMIDSLNNLLSNASNQPIAEEIFLD